MTDASTDSEPVTLPCANLDAAIAFYTHERGFRLDMIMPADAPHTALVSRGAITLRLQAPRGHDVPAALPANWPALVLRRAADNCAWPEGRAGMQYRDLIPGRVGGGVIASHIRIPAGGPVSDYVHYHKVGFQMIHCRRGWVRVVYEDQGPAFVMHAGDCVLQPPTIRHRVLESSAGLEVIEVGSPAVHETWHDHAMELPTSQLASERTFGGQRFVRHRASNAAWHRAGASGFEFSDSGIADATDGRASVRVLRATSSTNPHAAYSAARDRDKDVVFMFVLGGQLQLRCEAFGLHTLQADDACTLPPGIDYVVDATAPCEILEVVMNFASFSA